MLNTVINQTSNIISEPVDFDGVTQKFAFVENRSVVQQVRKTRDMQMKTKMLMSACFTLNFETFDGVATLWD